MATINQLRRERLAFFKELKRALRSVDTIVESSERKIERVLGRRLNVPETKDWDEVMDHLQKMLDSLIIYEQVIRAGQVLFQILL